MELNVQEEKSEMVNTWHPRDTKKSHTKHWKLPTWKYSRPFASTQFPNFLCWDHSSSLRISHHVSIWKVCGFPKDIIWFASEALAVTPLDVNLQREGTAQLPRTRPLVLPRHWHLASLATAGETPRQLTAHPSPSAGKAGEGLLIMSSGSVQSLRKHTGLDSKWESCIQLARNSARCCNKSPGVSRSRITPFLSLCLRVLNLLPYWVDAWHSSIWGTRRLLIHHPQYKHL